MRFLWLALFGVTGIFARYGIDVLAERSSWNAGASLEGFPFNTFLINIAGSALAGVLSVLAAERGTWVSADLRTGLMVGFLGGFTTFSAYALQSAKLFEDGRNSTAILYLCLSPAVGLFAAVAGLKLTRLWMSG